ncbi:MAG: DUF975 family protein [Lachnospiraceae bacterium]|nr:DUF975 family protein [Lachnospiraceae bacterium]
MWTRKELKQRGKAAFNFNYWKTVLVSLIVAVMLGGMSAGGAAAGGGTGAAPGLTMKYAGESGEEEIGEEIPDFEEDIPELAEGLGQGEEDIPELPEEFQQFAQEGPQIISVAVVLITMAVVFVVVAVIAFLISAFLLNPLEVGTKRFFVQNLHMPAEVKEIAFGYDHCYKNIVKTMFFRDLYTFLWSLLFIIPGIIKSYEYRMIPYLLSDHPEMTKEEAFARSKEMMRGQKWRAFVLDLSFILWELLSLLTLGILDIFYVGPYRHMTKAALYEALEYGNRQEESVVWTES